MLLHEITLRNLLSFGPDTPPLPLRPLNVFIGPNGSGKSNLIEALGLLRSAATKLTAPIRGPGGSGVREWIWKGSPAWHAHLEAVVENLTARVPLRHGIEFTEESARFALVDEWIENSVSDPGHERAYFFYRFQDGHPVLAVKDGGQRKLQRQDVAIDESILSQRQDPDQYPELAHLAQAYKAFRLYREWSFGRTSVFRAPQSADMPGDRLEEDFSNLGLFLNRLRSVPRVKKALVEHLCDLYAGLEDFEIGVKGGTVEVFLTEGNFNVPASRLSDGTLRYLCLLAILCDPHPPAVVCIEEPELGLHPDIIPSLARLLKEASARTQLFVTTHSDILIDEFTEVPEAVVVCEKSDGCTAMKRLDSAALKGWLEKYRLGQLWTKGQIGGTRW
ncbi:MAG: AAA family ATPase [Planctomycetota bacterium]|nr:AAA family ATPase [Planctomycetota bacterium]